MEEQNDQELYEHHRIVADAGQSPLRVDKFLHNRIENTSRSKVQVAAEAGNIYVNDRPVKSNYKVKSNDIVTVVLAHPPRVLELIPEDIPLNIVYEDADLLVLNKVAGMVVHPGHGNYTGTMINALMHHLKDEPLFKKGEMRPGLVHRIDKNTSGLLVVAKNEVALNHLAKQFFDRTTDRRYRAIVWGDMKEDQGTVTGNIARHLTNRLKMAVYPEGDQGKHAVTHYKVLERLGYINFIECKLETGRTHQIRVHMEYLRHPLFNDERYGGDKIIKGTTFSKYRQFVMNCFDVLPRHALHAKTLAFVHPKTGERMEFNTDTPADMEELLSRWRRYLAGRESKE